MLHISWPMLSEGIFGWSNVFEFSCGGRMFLEGFGVQARVLHLKQNCSFEFVC